MRSWIPFVLAWRLWSVHRGNEPYASLLEPTQHWGARIFRYRRRVLHNERAMCLR